MTCLKVFQYLALVKALLQCLIVKYFSLKLTVSNENFVFRNWLNLIRKSIILLKIFVLFQINWEALTDEDEEDLGAGKGNVIQKATPKCPTRESCRSCDNDNCWSSHHCQKNKTSNVRKGWCAFIPISIRCSLTY